MEKSFNKKMVALACGAVLALGGMAFAAHGFFTADAAEVPSGNQIILNAGEGELGQTAVTLTEDGKLPDLPVPTRAGWEFVGWFNEEVVENFWGDEESENPEHDDYKALKAAYSGYKNIYYQKGITPVEALSEDSDRGWKELTFNWILATQGDELKAGDTANGNTLYAMYAPDTYTVYWHFNGWLNTSGAPHRTMPEHGGYFVEYELDQFPSLAWANHTFLGWYTDPACTKEYRFQKVGAYKINEEVVEGDLHLYAKWESSVAFDGEIRVNKPTSLIEPKLNATFTVNCSYSLGASRDVPVITKWESSEPQAVVLVSAEGTSATFKLQDTEIFKNGNKQVTIYVTVDGTQYPAVDLTLGHSWGAIVKEKAPTCTEAGQTVYACKFCGETKTVAHEANGHRFVETKHPATCTEDAYTEIDCIACGLHEVKISENSKLGHSWSTHTDANCNGTTVATTCVRCGLTDTTFDSGAVVHNWDTKYTVDRAATCAKEGERSIHCLNCDARREETVIPATGEHAWGEWSVEREATTTETGMMVRSCETCGEMEMQKIPVLPAEPDKEEVEPELPAPEPETEAPEVEEPEVREPEVKEPEVKEPEVEAPEVEEPEVKETELPAPELKTKTVEPEIKQPEVAIQSQVEEAANVRSFGMQNNASANQMGTESNHNGAWLIVFVLAGVVVVLISISVAAVAVSRKSTKRK